jgi:hypothetical protein
MGGSSGGSEKTTSIQNSEPWKEQTPFLKYGMNEAMRLYQSNPPPQYYPGSTVAPFSAEQNQAFGLGAQRATQGNQSMKMAEGFGQDVMGGKYLNNPYDDQVFNNIQSKVMPAVNSNFMGSGRYGSGLHGDTMTRALTESYAPYASQNYQQGLDRMGQAASMAPMFAANDYTDLGALEAIGQQKQQLGQSELNDAAARWDYYQQLPYNMLGQFQASTGGSYGGSTFGQTKTPSQQPSMFQQVAGAGVGLLGSALSGGMFSDIRLKEDIARVGALDDGTPVYSYRYKAGGPVQIGVMAQDVEQRYPDAVSTHESGYKMVDYGKLSAEIGG